MMKKITLILSIFVVMSCTNEKSPNQKVQQGMFVHTVYFWLKNPDNQKDRKSFEESLTRFINASVYIRTKHIGTPAATDREVIDNSYTYSLILSFKDKTDQDKYQEEPNHKKFIEESSDLWEKVIVYDSENILE